MASEARASETATGMALRLLEHYETQSATESARPIDTPLEDYLLRTLAHAEVCATLAIAGELAGLRAAVEGIADLLGSREGRP